MNIILMFGVCFVVIALSTYTTLNILELVSGKSLFTIGTYNFISHSSNIGGVCIMFGVVLELVHYCVL